MAVVVLLRGVNVGGHRRFRPAEVARALRHLDCVNIGAAGTFVIRRRVSRASLRPEFARRLPFETEIAICEHSSPKSSRATTRVRRAKPRTRAGREGLSP